MEFSSALFWVIELFCFFFKQTLYNIRYLLTYCRGSVWMIIHGTGRSVRTVHIIFAKSLHDCKIVNTDYLLTLFYLELGFIWKAFESRSLRYISKWLARMALRKSAVTSCSWCSERGIWDFIFFVLSSSGIHWLSICKCFRLQRKPWGL